MQKVNPKSVSLNSLFGSINSLTNEWNDGIIGSIVKDSVENEMKEASRWLVLDGYFLNIIS